MSTGTVKWFSPVKGHGFIEPTDGGPELFVHFSAIQGEGYRNLQQGDAVEFETVDRGRGPAAVDVKLKAVSLNSY